MMMLRHRIMNEYTEKSYGIPRKAGGTTLEGAALYQAIDDIKQRGRYTTNVNDDRAWRPA